MGGLGREEEGLQTLDSTSSLISKNGRICKASGGKLPLTNYLWELSLWVLLPSLLPRRG